jgi:hypothetical protein
VGSLTNIAHCSFYKRVNEKMTKRVVARERRVVQPGDHAGNPYQMYIIGGVVVLAVVALGVLLFLNLQEPSAISGITRFAGLARGHDETVTYPETGLPPSGGNHDPAWQNCGIYEQPIETKHVLHSLEHGAVWLTYSPELSAGDVEELREQARGNAYVIMSPFPGLSSEVVVTAWGLQLIVDDVDDRRIGTFIDRYQQGPQTPEFGGSCSDGVGTPAEQP